MIVFDGILKLKYFPCFKRSLYILIFWAVIFLSNDYYASRQIHERNLKINEIYNSIDKGMDSGDYRSVYEILESRLLPRQSPVDSIIFESHSARYYSPEFYVRSKMIEFIKNGESSKVIDFLNLGKGKLRYFEIGPEAWYLAVNNNDFNFFGFYLDYWNWIDLKKAKPISALTGSRPYLLGGNKYTDYYSVSRFYGKLLSIGNMSMIREYEDFFIENEKGDFFNDAINRYRKEDDAPILISGSLISNVLKSGEVDVLKHAVKLGLVKLYPFMISYYIAEYPKTKPVLIYILDQLGGALENKGLAPRSLFSIIESINYRTSYKHKKNAYYFLKSYGVMDDLKDYKQPPKGPSNENDNYQVLLMLAWVDELDLFESYLESMPLDAINNDKGSTIYSYYNYPAGVFSITNNLEGIYLLERYGYKFEESSIVNSYLKFSIINNAFDTSLFLVKFARKETLDHMLSIFDWESQESGRHNLKANKLLHYLMLNAPFGYSSPPVDLKTVAAYGDESLFVAYLNRIVGSRSLTIEKIQRDIKNEVFVKLAIKKMEELL